MNNRSIEKNEEVGLVFDDHVQKEGELLDDQIWFSGLYQKNNLDSSSFSSIGFMDMLDTNDHQNHNFGYFADEFTTQSPVLPELSEVVNTPTTIVATSNSPSISSSSHDDPTQRPKPKEEEVEDQEHNKTKIQLKAKKKNTKKEREPRFAFMTKSEVDHLDDGYRWRKYGQKAVKNSPFPRSYHRCTTATCGVKKRVERSCEDSSIVVTTYEGIHTHPCPVASHHRAHNIGLLRPDNSAFVLLQPFSSPYQHHHHQQPHYYGNQTPILSFHTSNMVLSEREYSSPLLRGSGEYQHGLLQDNMPIQMQMMEPKQE